MLGFWGVHVCVCVEPVLGSIFLIVCLGCTLNPAMASTAAATPPPITHRGTSIMIQGERGPFFSPIACTICPSLSLSTNTHLRPTRR